MRIIKRLEKLVASTQSCVERLVRVIKTDDETNYECIRRHNFDPDEEGLNFIIRVII